jgi:hypothetical protein
MCWKCRESNIYLVFGLRKSDHEHELMALYYSREQAWAYAAHWQHDEDFIDAWAEGHRISDADEVGDEDPQIRAEANGHHDQHSR